MSFTRDNPPTMEELKRDWVRQERLRSKVLEIEEREKQERIAQGFLNPDGTEIDRDKLEAPPGLEPQHGIAQRGFDLPRTHVQEASEAMGQETYLAPPREKVDPKTGDQEELRRLAMEDTKRRMEESGVAEHREQDDVQGVDLGFKPRQRKQA